MLKLLLTVVLTGALGAAGRPAPAPTAPTAPRRAAAPAFDHSAYDRLLKKYVDAKGLVNYKAWKADQQGLNQYLARLSQNPPAATWPQAEQIAYWINAYNAYTIRLILDHYPLRSIKDIGSKIQIPLVNTPWAAEFFSIGGRKMSLDYIEHTVLRKQFDDPRIHFALVCASLSCPRLRPEAYTAARLSPQLDAQGRDFLRDPAKNKVGKTSAQLSRYFDWYKADWSQNGQSVASWVNRYAATPMSPDARISYLDYNWQLNEQ
ncbi:DUF547 domain-containing protein [Hymenobacter gummosus]|uniref:DUF547 domain-containing protein n=1 Tax=Hymenobacter gummosus TaxID=1776032 RepID=A0A3S0H7D3_9BACT|nr:DUF547 domain-containing protein [Hymenobacter gummosus]RTQ47485.1 DUF547 domain-containing protein [Hymenobacter gummosus]